MLRMPCLERGMKYADAMPDAPAKSLGTRQAVLDVGRTFTPGVFLRQAGTVVAVCLGLALLAQLIIPGPGPF